MSHTFTAHCLTVRNPFHPMRDRQHQIIDEPIPIRDLAPSTDKPFLIVRNGDYVLRADWDQEVKNGDNLAVVFMPQGGDDGGSEVLKVVLLIIIAYFSGGWGASLAGPGNAGLAAAYTAAISMAGSASINITLEAAQ